jgi:putative ABC transport system ATP-binding protein
VIELLSVKKYYTMGDTVVKALDGVTMRVEDKEFVAVIGPSGSGKSTLMNIIGCLDSPDEGSYLLDGIPIGDYTANQQAEIRNRKIGFIFQQFNLLPRLTARENVELPLIYAGMNARDRRERAEDVLSLVGLADRKNHRPSELSGGQQQRVAIARAVAARPTILLADEPTGNLDSRSGKEIIEMLHRIHRAGNTLLLITHDSSVAAQAQRRLCMTDGRLTPAEET